MDATRLCGCGCGEPAGVYKTSNSAAGIVAGESKDFIHGHHSRGRYRNPADFDNLYTIQPNGCWTWDRLDPYEDGYGRFHVGKERIGAHRYSYRRSKGAIPQGAHIDHLCHDPQECAGGSTCPHRACVNPEHLAVTSHAENCRRGNNSKLDLDKAREIRARFSAGERGVDLAKEFNVTTTAISSAVNNKTWRE